MMALKCGTRYPWERWFVPGKKIRLRKGRDYTCLTLSFQQLLYRAAARLGWEIESTTAGNNEGVTVQTVGKIRKKRRQRAVGCSAA